MFLVCITGYLLTDFVDRMAQYLAEDVGVWEVKEVANLAFYMIFGNFAEKCAFG